MSEFYTEIFVLPKDFGELFADILSHTAIEFVESNSIFCPEIPPLEFFPATFTPDKNAEFMLVRVESSAEVAKILEALKNLASALNTAVGVGVKTCQNADWIEVYKNSITPIETEKFIISPSWAAAKSGKKSNKTTIIIDPALAFGSGHHATTKACLNFLENEPLRDKTLLDVGSGSGILAIAAAKMGAVVSACDTDALAVSECAKNANANAVALKAIVCGSAGEFSGVFDVVVANILASVLCAIKPALSARVRPGGTLILSGILDKYESSIHSAYTDFTLVDSIKIDDWVALKFKK